MMKMTRCRGVIAFLALALFTTCCRADQPPLAATSTSSTPAVKAELNSGDTAWMLTSSALVLMMTAPGLALFYGGLVRKKNILSVMMQCMFIAGLMTVVWVLWGYSLAFSDDLPGTHGLIGGFGKFAMNGVTAQWDPTGGGRAVFPRSELAPTIPEMVYLAYQGMFFAITPCLICGAFAERMKFSTMCVFLVLWATFVYCPIAHWVWSAKGWLHEGNYAALDFAGGTVVHVSSGFSALICALVLGRRLGYGQEPMPPHNLTYTCIGAGLLWVGWFGFNAGSAVSAGESAANAFVSTHLATAAGLLAWPAAEWLFRGKPSVLGACSGAVAGLVCITPGCGYVSPLSGLLIGLAAGFVCYSACTTLKSKFGYDDSLDAFGVHGVGGFLGCLLTGVFATKAVTGKPMQSGLIEGNARQLVNQGIGALAAMVLTVVATFIILKVLDVLMGLRVSPNDEIQGLDLSQHGEEGYIFL